MRIIINLLLFITSNLGYWEFLRRNTKINKVFYPSLTIAFDISILFIGGLLNLLNETAIIIFIIGILYSIYVVLKEKNIKFIKEYINTEYFFLFIVYILLVLYLKGKVFTTHDNFSHWALVARQIIITDRFPNFRDSIIYYQGYPLGSSVYIYYFAKIIAFDEPMMMAAQAYIMITSILPLFYYAKNNKISILIGVTIITNFFLVYCIEITELLVDTLLPLVSMCGLFYICLYCYKKNDEMSYWLGSAYLIEMMQIKNSGIFFVIIGIFIIVCGAIKNRNIKSGVFLSLIPFASKILWNKHCDYVFINASTTKHSMRFGSFELILKEKTIDDINKIVRLTIKYILTCNQIWICLIIVTIIFIIAYFYNKKYSKNLIKLFYFSIISYALYIFGLIGMYIFSMPLSEAIKLSSIFRYVQTILMSLIYVSIIVLIQITSNKKKILNSLLVVMIPIILTSTLMFENFGEYRTVFIYRGDPTTRFFLEELKDKYNIKEHSSYRILQKENDSGYLFHLVKYIFRSPDVEAIIVSSEEDVSNIKEKYLLILDKENEIINNWIEQNYPNQIGKDVVVTGDIDE